MRCVSPREKGSATPVRRLEHLRNSKSYEALVTAPNRRAVLNRGVGARGDRARDTCFVMGKKRRGRGENKSRASESKKGFGFLIAIRLPRASGEFGTPPRVVLLTVYVRTLDAGRRCCCLPRTFPGENDRAQSKSSSKLFASDRYRIYRIFARFSPKSWYFYVAALRPADVINLCAETTYETSMSFATK